MVTLNLEDWPNKRHVDYKLIKLIRALKPQSTLREIDEKPATYDRNRLREYDMESDT